MLSRQKQVQDGIKGDDHLVLESQIFRDLIDLIFHALLLDASVSGIRLRSTIAGRPWTISGRGKPPDLGIKAFWWKTLVFQGLAFGFIGFRSFALGFGRA